MTNNTHNGPSLSAAHPLRAIPVYSPSSPPFPPPSCYTRPDRFRQFYIHVRPPLIYYNVCHRAPLLPPSWGTELSGGRGTLSRTIQPLFLEIVSRCVHVRYSFDDFSSARLGDYLLFDLRIERKTFLDSFQADSKFLSRC